jgi:hypothetical protein
MLDSSRESRCWTISLRYQAQLLNYIVDNARFEFFVQHRWHPKHKKACRRKIIESGYHQSIVLHASMESIPQFVLHKAVSREALLQALICSFRKSISEPGIRGEATASLAALSLLNDLF